MFIKNILAQKNISQRKLARLANIAETDLNQALNNKKPFFPNWRKRVSVALGMSEAEVFPEFESIEKVVKEEGHAILV